MISAKFLWGNVLLGGKQQIDAKKFSFEIFERALFMKSVSMPLNGHLSSKTSSPNIKSFTYQGSHKME